MHLVQIFLPVSEGTQAGHFGTIRDELTAQFGGSTAYVQSPAEGLWKDGTERTVKDKVVVVEVMTNDIDHEWWKAFQREVEARLGQEKILIRIIGGQNSLTPVTDALIHPSGASQKIKTARCIFL